MLRPCGQPRAGRARRVRHSEPASVLSHGEYKAAVEDLRAAIDLAPAGSPAREALRQTLEQLIRRMRVP